MYKFAKLTETPQQIPTISPNAEGSMYLFPMLAQSTTVDLNWDQVDCVQKTVQFPGTVRSQGRVMPISAELATLLSKKQREIGVVFKTYYREPFTRLKLTRAVNEFKLKGYYRRPWNLLDLRHSFGTNFLAGGGNLRELQYLMGHENIFDTKRIFASSPTQSSVE